MRNLRAKSMDPLIDLESIHLDIVIKLIVSGCSSRAINQISLYYLRDQVPWMKKDSSTLLLLCEYKICSIVNLFQ